MKSFFFFMFDQRVAFLLLHSTMGCGYSISQILSIHIHEQIMETQLP